MKQKISELEQQRFSYLLNKQYDEFAAMCDADLHYVHSSVSIRSTPYCGGTQR